MEKFKKPERPVQRMTLLKRTLYMMLGFTFPFFWAYHAAGFGDFLFRPIQLITSTQNKIWPSFITAFLIYTGTVIFIEKISKPNSKKFNP